jgi:hypothetical protein
MYNDGIALRSHEIDEEFVIENVMNILDDIYCVICIAKTNTGYVRMYKIIDCVNSISEALTAFVSNYCRI